MKTPKQRLKERTYINNEKIFAEHEIKIALEEFKEWLQQQDVYTFVLYEDKEFIDRKKLLEELEK